MEISVVVEKYQDGFLADIKTFENCFTEASTFSELVEIVNDAVRTHLEVSEIYKQKTPRLRGFFVITKRVSSRARGRLL